jgi:hypothetical protein
MKTITLICSFVLTALLSSSQVARFDQIKTAASYDEYVTSTGESIFVGDTLRIGKPAAGVSFVNITQGNVGIKSSMAGKKVVITQIKSYGKEKQGYTIYVQFKGFGIPVYIDYDNALDAGEIISPANVNRRQE